MTSPQITIVMRSKNDGDIIGSTIDSVLTQTLPVREILVFDNDSTDSTPDILYGYGSLVSVHRVPEGSYMPGEVLNTGTRESRTDIVVYLNSDAPPENTLWLENLYNCMLKNPGVVFSRQLPRENARISIKRDYASAFPLSDRKYEKSERPCWNNFFSIVSCMTLRNIAIEHPLSEELRYSEDTEWANRISSQGIEVRYCSESCVRHSHNYSFLGACKRFYNEGKADQVIYFESNLQCLYALIKAPLRLVNTVRCDFREAIKSKKEHMLLEIWYSIQFRFAQIFGKTFGSLSTNIFGKPT